MATTFLEPGGDSTFTTGLWSTFGSPAVATDFVHGNHIKSIKFRANNDDEITKPSVLADAGTRFSVWIYLNALPTGTAYIILLQSSGGSTNVIQVKISSGGILRLVDSANTQIGSDGATLSTGIWYRISMAYVITSTTVNDFRVFVNGVLSITAHNATIASTGTNQFDIGNTGPDATLDLRASDFYIDNSNALTDPGNIWVTAKRSFSNGTTNGMTGTGTPSGYGSGNARYVNERPNNDSNYVSVVGAGSAITEEYNIEGKTVGDINISGSTIVDYMGWVRAKSLSSETGSIIVNNATSSISLTSTTAFFTAIAGSTTYPANTGTDIGIITTTALTTVSLYEAGMIVAYIPATSTYIPSQLSQLGVG